MSDITNHKVDHSAEVDQMRRFCMWAAPPGLCKLFEREVLLTDRVTGSHEKSSDSGFVQQ